MATRNEYEMLFKLSAQLGQDFNGTFSSAQKTLAATQKEIQSLNKLQSDISSYAKQQQSVESLEAKLSIYQQQLQNVRQEISASDEYSASLANKELDLKQRIEQTEISLKQKSEALKRTGDALLAAGVDTQNLSQETKRLGEEVDSLKEKQEQAAEEAEHFGDVGSNSAAAVGEALAAAGITALLKEIYELYGDCVVGAAAFGDEIGTVAVQYGIAAQDLQAYYYAAELVDVSVETLTSTMARNVRAMSEAQSGTERYAEAYEKLGVSVINTTDGSLRNSEAVYWDVIDALGNMQNASERDALAMELLGRSAQQINTLIAAGSGVMDEYARMAEQAGYIMDEKMLASVMALDDELQIQKNNMTALKNAVGAQFAPEITAALQVWNDMLAGMTEFADENPVVVKSLIALGLELTTIVGAYSGYVAVKKTATALKALNVALTAKETAATTAHTAATVAQTAATTSATAAQTGLNAAMSANPIGLTLAAVSALTVGIISLSSVISEASKNEDQLTAKSKAEYAQLQKLDAQYKNVCKTYGETSYEAQALKWEVDELSEAYENGKMTVQEYAEESAAYLEELRRAREEYLAIMQEFDSEYGSSMSLIEKLEQLSTASESVTQNQAAIIPIVDALNEKYKSLGLTFDSMTGKFNITFADMKEVAEAEVSAQKAEAAWKRYVQLVSEAPANEGAIKDAQAIYDASNAAYENAKKEYEEYTSTFGYWLELIGTSLGGAGNQDAYYNLLQRDKWDAFAVSKSDKEELDKKIAAYRAAQEEMRDIEREYGFSDSMDTSSESAQKLVLAVEAVSKEYMSAEEAGKHYGVAVTRINAQIQARSKTEAALASAIKAVRDGFLTASEAAVLYGVSVSSIETHEKIKTITDEITALSDAYQEAYREAYDSVSGQYQLWDKAAEVIPTDVEIINAALETQTAYWHDYNVDLQSLRERSADIEGLSEVIASFADGSKESVNTVAGMAQMTDDELGKMVANWRALQEEQRSASESLATMDSDYVAELELLQNELKATINDLNLAEEAENAANETMDAYIEALKVGADEAATIAQQLATQIGISLNTANGVITVSGATAEAGIVPVGGSPSLGREIISGGVSKSAVGTKPLVPRKELSYRIYHTGGLVGDVATLSESEEFAKLLKGEFVSSPAQMKHFMEVVLPQIAEYRSTVNALDPDRKADQHFSPSTYTVNLSSQLALPRGERESLEKEIRYYGTYHTGGLVGDVAKLSEREEFAKLVKEVLVYTPEQTKSLTEYIIPQIAEYKASIAAANPNNAAEAQSSYGAKYDITISPQFTLQGVNSDNMEDKFLECGEVLVDMVIDKLEEIGIDAKRSAYA